MVNYNLHFNDLDTFAQNLARELKIGDAVFLYGPLGAGKASFARALIRTLCQDHHMDVPSPTFPLCLIYEDSPIPIWHYDLYRLEENVDIITLDWDEARKTGLAIVEWPQRMTPSLRYSPIMNIDFAFTDDENIRKITVERE